MPPSEGSRSPLTPPRRSGIPPQPGRRVLDIAVALLILAVSLPLLLTIAVAATVSTGGSPIFRQRRIGQGGMPFTLYKFRTMRAGVSGPGVTAPGDRRVTRLGALLRKTSIDELPQMVNVLLGRMTLVGPRPESVSLAARYPPEFRFIFQYRPGVTGPSQVLVRDEKVLAEVGDVETFYLAQLGAAPGRDGPQLPEQSDAHADGPVAGRNGALPGQAHPPAARRLPRHSTVGGGRSC